MLPTCVLVPLVVVMAGSALANPLPEHVYLMGRDGALVYPATQTVTSSVGTETITASASTIIVPAATDSAIVGVHNLALGFNEPDEAGNVNLKRDEIYNLNTVGQLHAGGKDSRSNNGNPLGGDVFTNGQADSKREIAKNGSPLGRIIFTNGQADSKREVAKKRQNGNPLGGVVFTD